ncbi:outer membrane receptor protein involved in Fe transport [Novosphingobium chloroacetimidivorans]|uniref:Outer membrane receptor protein involved in Fe transport n=1 Tax=Novosphingobium chloroacetimidivorans TaxID=1428314 RepID=A0A7W7KD00_9SPHN|nr:TonB-dependent receptor [Novosphingobium chloroacetimidivorans]MBB4860250.1 outer membrane receptor protein involved in Fe transport [Novosphingobium chloroacetimidivorans]
MNTRYRARLLNSSLLVSAALIATPALAQTADPDSQPKTGVQSSDPAAPAAGTSSADAAPPAGENSTGEIIVTGSLIRNPNIVASSPVSVIGQEELNLRQVNTAEQVLRDLPGAVPSIGSAVNNGNGGAAFADLRGLGNFRNVVLLDGNRIAPSGVVGRVDLNNIPLALIERVDTLTGGAATTYGADAVSGVINFITRSDFTGVELNASEQITERGDGETSRIDLTIGGNFDDDRGNAVLSVGYQNADPVYQGQRKYSLNNYTSTSGGRGGSGTTVPGRFTLGTAFNSIVPATGSLRPYLASRDGYNFNPFNVFQVPFERFNIYGAAHYDVADNIKLYTRGLFSKNQVSTIIAPSGLFSSGVVVPLSNPYLPAAARQQFCNAGNVFLAGQDPINNLFNANFNPGGVSPQGPLSAAACSAAAAATNPADPNFRTVLTTVGRRFVEAGPRQSDYTTQIFDYRAGLKIDITETINLDLSGSYGESSNRQTQTGYVLTSRARAAAYATNTTTCLGGAPAGSSAAGCVPVNLFGEAGSITAAQLPYLTQSATTEEKTSLAQARALLSGDFGGASSPWADEPIGFALGGEFRKYRAEQIADSLSQTAGELGGAGGAVPNFRGGYQVYEAFGEVIAPLVVDRPFFKSLTVEGGLRYSHYNVQGGSGYNTTTYKGAGTWEPVEGLKLRGNYQRAVRAPNINELFAPSNTGLTNLASDPCSGTRPITNPALAPVCIAQGAPPAAIGLILNPTSAQANGTTSGSLNIRPEKADSYTLGVVFQPTFVPGLSITVDYYHIRIKNAISQPTVGDIVGGCFDAPSVSNPLCQLIRRNPVTGGLDGDPSTTQGIIFPLSNSGRILTDGIDVSVNYRRDLGFAKLNLSFMGNWTNRSEFTAIVPGSLIPAGFPGAGGALPASDARECVGLYGQNCGSPGSAGPNSAPGSLQPEFTWNQRTTLTFGSVDVSLLWRHIDSMKVEPGVVAFEGTIASGALAGKEVNFGRIKAANYFDLSGRIGVSDNLDMTLTVMNLFDKQPPLVGGTIGSTSFNSGNTYPSTYDALGRRFAVGARFKF